MRALVALAGDASVPGFSGASRRVRPSASPKPQAAAIEQGQQRDVALAAPRLAREFVDGAERARGLVDGERLRHRFGSFGVRTAASAALRARPRRSRKRKKLRSTDSARAVELRFSASAARRARKARKSAGAQRRELGEARHRAEMLGQEIEERGEVEAVGGDACAARRGAPRRASPAMRRWRRRDRVWRRSARAAAARARAERRLRRQVEPCGDGDAERAGEEAQQLGALARRGICPARRVPMQSSPAGAAALDRQAQHRRRAHQPGAVAEQPSGRPRYRLSSNTSRSAPSTASTVPGSRICTP